MQIFPLTSMCVLWQEHTHAHHCTHITQNNKKFKTKKTPEGHVILETVPTSIVQTNKLNYCDLSDGPNCLISPFTLSFDFSVYWSAFCCCGKMPVAINTRGKGLFGSWFMRL